MPVTEIGDPRLQALFGAANPREAGIEPVVRLPRKGVSPIFFAVLLLAFGVALFAWLDARRLNSRTPAIRAAASDVSATTWDAPPPLYVPPTQEPDTEIAVPQVVPTQRQILPLRAPSPSPHAVVVSPIAQPASLPAILPAPAPALQQRTSTGSALVIDAGSADGSGPTAPSLGAVAAGVSATSRMRASALANRSMTVPQGYLIPAVLETGFDSTKPGFARATVAKDVRGFDGRNVLIPRGSRLIGEYRSEASQTQKRAIIRWTRLIRPDGMTIALDSPAVDTLGRGGIPASVNTHFLKRVGDALLQSTIGIGSALAQRRVSGPVVVVPGATANAVASANIASGADYVPTLTVPPGKSISVFVAHDLDFSAAGAAQ